MSGCDCGPRRFGIFPRRPGHHIAALRLASRARTVLSAHQSGTPPAPRFTTALRAQWARREISGSITSRAFRRPLFGGGSFQRRARVVWFLTAVEVTGRAGLIAILTQRGSRCFGAAAEPTG